MKTKQLISIIYSQVSLAIWWSVKFLWEKTPPAPAKPAAFIFFYCFMLWKMSSEKWSNMFQIGQKLKRWKSFFLKPFFYFAFPVFVTFWQKFLSLLYWASIVCHSTICRLERILWHLKNAIYQKNQLFALFGKLPKNYRSKNLTFWTKIQISKNQWNSVKIL